MLFVRVVRAWLGSVATCAVFLLVVWVVSVGDLRGPQNDLEQVTSFAFIGIGLAFAITAAGIYIPTFILFDTLLGTPLNRARAVLVGGILALVPRLLFAWRVEESQSATAWLLYWARHLPQFPVTMLPFAIGGVAFGLLWWKPAKNQHDIVAPRTRRAV